MSHHIFPLGKKKLVMLERNTQYFVLLNFLFLHLCCDATGIKCFRAESKRTNVPTVIDDFMLSLRRNICHVALCVPFVCSFGIFNDAKKWRNRCYYEYAQHFKHSLLYLACLRPLLFKR